MATTAHINDILTAPVSRPAREFPAYDPRAFRAIVNTTLQLLQLWSPEAEELLMGTAAQESHLGRWRQQIGGGPGKGVYQIEVATLKDIYTNYLDNRPALSRKVLEVTGVYGPSVHHTTYDPVYGTVLARLYYRRIKEPLPAATDIWGLARYWKDHYNTKLGKGTVKEFVQNYHRLVTTPDA